MRKLSAVALIVLAVRLAARDEVNSGQVITQFKPNLDLIEVRKVQAGECELYVASGPIRGTAPNPISVAIATGKGCVK